MAEGGLPEDIEALRTTSDFPLLDCGEIPQSDGRLTWRRERFGDPQRVVSVAVRQAGRVALVRGRSDPPDWSLPGGGVEAGESFEQAAVREAKEECGLDIAPLHPLAIVRARLVASASSMQWLDVVFAARSIGGTLRPVDVKEVDETQWAEVGELEGLYARGRLALSWLSFERSTEVPGVDARLLAILGEFVAGGGGAEGIPSSAHGPSG